MEMRETRIDSCDSDDPILANATQLRIDGGTVSIRCLWEDPSRHTGRMLRGASPPKPEYKPGPERGRSFWDLGSRRNQLVRYEFR